MFSLFLLLIEEESDREKFEYIYKKYSNYMYKIALKNAANEMVAKEILSDSFLAVLDNIKILRTDNDIALRSYLAEVVKNKFYDRTRKDSSLPLNFENFDNVADNSDIAKELEEKEQANAILEIILKMPKLDRYIMYFRYNENYSIRNIAKLFNLSDGTVRKILKKGVLHIITSMQNNEKYGI